MNSTGRVHSVSDMWRLISKFPDLGVKMRGNLQEVSALLRGKVLGSDIGATMSILA